MARKVLLVEDDPRARESLAALLRREGFEVTAAGSAEEAAAEIGDRFFDIAVIDIRLPGMRGDVFARQMRSRRPWTRLVFISGEFHVEDLEEGEEDVPFFAKPLDLDGLLKVLHTPASCS